MYADVNTHQHREEFAEMKRKRLVLFMVLLPFGIAAIAVIIVLATGPGGGSIYSGGSDTVEGIFAEEERAYRSNNVSEALYNICQPSFRTQMHQNVFVHQMEHDAISGRISFPSGDFDMRLIDIDLRNSGTEAVVDWELYSEGRPASPSSSRYIKQDGRWYLRCRN